MTCLQRGINCVPNANLLLNDLFKFDKLIGYTYISNRSYISILQKNERENKATISMSCTLLANQIVLTIIRKLHYAVMRQKRNPKFPPTCLPNSEHGPLLREINYLFAPAARCQQKSVWNPGARKGPGRSETVKGPPRSNAASVPRRSIGRSSRRQSLNKTLIERQWA